MDTAITSAALVIGLLLLWTGRRRLEFSSFATTLLSVIEVVGFLFVVLALGWLGVAILVGVNVVAVLVWSAMLAMKKEAILVAASVQGNEISADEADEIWRWMGREPTFARLSPLTRAELIRALSAQARKLVEIQAMAVPIVQLATVFECDPVWLAPRFDQLLRLHEQDAQDATALADALTRGAQLAAASFEEMVEAMISAPVSSNDATSDESLGASDRGSEQHQLWESLRANAEIQVHEAGEDGVRLQGGPMDGWLVKRDAPAFAVDWHKTWPPTIARQHAPGHYELADSGSWAQWVSSDR